jgi:hypothetical protein
MVISLDSAPHSRRIADHESMLSIEDWFFAHLPIEGEM